MPLLRPRPDRLHPTTEAVYRFIIRYKRQHAGDSPTRREICAGVGIAGPSTVHYHLTVLKERGRIELPGSKARMIAIPGASWAFEEIAGSRELNKCEVMESSADGTAG